MLSGADALDNYQMLVLETDYCVTGNISIKCNPFCIMMNRHSYLANVCCLANDVFDDKPNMMSC
jgi:hypothetical protein